MATLGVVFPSLVIISILAGLINNFADLAWVQNAFAGIQVCVCVLIFNATVKPLKKSVVDKPTAAIFLAVLVGGAVMDVSPVWFILAAAVLGILLKNWEVKGHDLSAPVLGVFQDRTLCHRRRYGHAALPPRHRGRPPAGSPRPSS